MQLRTKKELKAHRFKGRSKILFFLGHMKDPKTFTEMLVERSHLNTLLKYTKQNIKIKCFSILKINNWDIKFQNTTPFRISS